MKSFTLGQKTYSYLDPYIIAEIGVNHEGSLDRAKRLIDGAAAGGAHAAKFQTYKAEKLAAATTSPAYWDQTKEAADSQFALFKRWDNFTDDDYRALAKHCEDVGVHFLSTPFDLDAVDVLTPLMPVTKIASADITNVPLLRKVAATGRPLIVSVGASRLDEIAGALQELKASGATDVTLLHCVLNYPTPPAQAKLAQIPELARIFGAECAIGYSDHVTPDADGTMPALEMASLLGAVVLEKHFTDDKNGVGNDHYHAMTSEDLKAFTQKLESYRTLHGVVGIDLSTQDKAIKNARRRIVTAQPITPGTVIGADQLIALRSDRGIEISHWDRVVGRTAGKQIESGASLEWTDLA